MMQQSAHAQSSGSTAKTPPQELLLRAELQAAAVLGRQILDEASDDFGGYADEYGLVTPQSGGGVIASLGAVWLCPASRYYRDPELARRMALGAGFLERRQLPSGNIDLLITNFDSPPDTGFVTHNVAPVAILAQRAGETEMVRTLMPFLRRAGAGMAVGGVHTPNHRWVVASALALIHHLEPQERYTRRIQHWLDEGIDIDKDGLYTERSPLVYTPVVNRSLIYLAEFGARPELLQYVDQSLQAALFLMHPNGELVTELSGRQDQNLVGSMGVNWLALKCLAAHPTGGSRRDVYAALARRHQPAFGDLLHWLFLPAVQEQSTSEAEPPSAYEKDFGEAAVWRVRRQSLSATLLYRGYDRILSLRRGDAVIEAVRFASAFFGKGQFVADEATRDGDAWVMRQQMRGPYYQPLDPPEQVASDPVAWSESRNRRVQSEIASIEQRCIVSERDGGFQMEVSVTGTPNVPVSIEMNVRDGVEIEGIRSAPSPASSFLTTGAPVVLRKGKDVLRIEAPRAVHGYTEVRGSRPKLPGRSVYVTGISPFHARLVFA